MKPTHYDITVRGEIGDTLTGAFGGLTAHPAEAQTVFRGVIADRAALYGVLERMEDLGLELLDVRRTVSP